MARKIAQIGPLESHLGTQPKATARNQGRPSGSLTPQPDDGLSETTFAVQDPAGSGRHQAVPLHDKHVFGMHVGCAVPAPPKRAVIGADRSQE